MTKIKAGFRRLTFYWLAVALLTITTYVLYKVAFAIPADNMMQEFLLLINPISSSVLLLGIALLFKNRMRNIMVVVLSFVGSLILYVNLLFYRFYTDFLTLPVLLQTNNMQDLSGSVFELMSFWDVFLFTNVAVLWILVARKKVPVVGRLKREPSLIFALAILLFLGNLSLAQTERPQLLTRSFDRDMIVKNIGVFNFHIYDVFLQSQSRAQRVLADSSDIVEVKNYTQANHKEPNPDLFGVAEGKNVFMISLESLQSFVIDNDVYGQEITPFLNQLKEESYYFENFYHQTEQGKTSDSEFIVANSLFARSSGAVFFTHAQNDYNALPEILGENGYYSSVMHANNRTFWNRDVIYDTLGYDRFFDVDSYEVTEENSVGWGLKDKEFFEQSIDLLKEQPQPFYTKFITLTNHFPFELGEEDKMIEEYDSNSGTLNRYFPTVRYMDYAVEQFFEDIKEAGLYEDSIFILYGDHYGISDNHNRAMAMYLDKEEITPFDSVQLQRVPLIIHIPGHEGETFDTVGGQIDIKPTLMHLLGLSTKEDIQFGSDLFSPEHESYAVLRNGNFITDDLVYANNTCYDKHTGVETEDPSSCEEFIPRAQSDLEYSDKIIYGDLLRFFEPDNDLFDRSEE
ncbi:lipoteichoic acid synthase-like YqgS [Shouchella clausii]|uniref:LTA synthase family protein n=1 Tax=Shouchella tritolerans TaxID=2979466 RepID=UPI0007884E0C|nr:LTA synthase family protein [Shouchella tritolerans]GIN13850.1 lipoteichoic acid synthase-like YqgS [Shouchella clausii]